MSNYIKDITIAFLGGSFALFLQWYIIRLERLKTRRSVLYNLLEVYSNLLRIERIGNLDSFLNDFYLKLEIPQKEIEFATPVLKKQLVDIIFTELISELNSLSFQYSEAVKELAKDRPILAFEISHLANSIKISSESLENFISNLSNQFSEYDNSKIEEIINDILKKYLISDNVKEIKSAILKVSYSISFISYFKTFQKVKHLNNIGNIKHELETFSNEIVTKFRESEKLGNF